MRKLITILFVIIGQVSFGQVYQIMPQYGYSAPRFNTDSTLQLPTFNGVPTLKSNKTNKGAIAIDSTNGRFYFYNPKTSAWNQITGGGGGSTDTSSLSNRINLKIDSIKKSNDSIYYYANGVRTFSYKDIGGGGGSTDTTSLSNRINLKIDSLKRFNDTIYTYKNGNRSFAFKDSVGTNPAPVGYYGAFNDTTTQSAAVINTAYPIKLNRTTLSNAVTIQNNGSGQPTRITINNTGIYNIQFSLQLEKTGGSGNMTADIWLRENGIDVPNSTGKVVLTGSANASPVIASWNYVINVVGGYYYELMWSASNVNIEIVASVASSPHPAIPSAILTVTQQSGIMAGTGIQAADTTAMLIPYMKKNDSTIYYSKYRSDTSRTNIYSGINSKLNTSDSAIYYTKFRSDSSRTNIYSGINTKLAKSDTSTLSSRIDLKLDKSMSSYTFMANNTNATANASANTFRDTTGVYTVTPVWTGTTQPSGTTNHSFRYTQIGKMCVITINLLYSSAGSGLTIAEMPLPSFCATPSDPTGFTSTNDFVYNGSSMIFSSKTMGATPNAPRLGYMKKTASGYSLISHFGATGGALIFASCTVTYYTN